jgi:hypothetical protein
MYGITYTATSKSGLTWDGENAFVTSTIGTFGGEYLYIECTNKVLRQTAEELAWKRLAKEMSGEQPYNKSIKPTPAAYARR